MREAIELLSKKRPISQSVIKYANSINLWRSWWIGRVPTFHIYQVNDPNGGLQKLERNSMKMAKTVAEDWANLLMNESTFVDVTDESTQKYLSGDKESQEGGLFNDIHFWVNANEVGEKSYSLGTAGIVITIKNAMATEVEDGYSLNTGDVRYKYILDAENIIPLSWNQDEITECAFVEKYYEGVSEYMHIQNHEFSNRTEMMYIITNSLYERVNKKEWRQVPYDGVEEYHTPAKLFHILKPRIANNVDSTSPYGVSIYANAIDQLKACDLAFDNFGTDLILGRKKVFMDQDLFSVTKTEDGRTRVQVGDTIEQSLFYSIGTQQPGEKKEYYEYNPALRVADNKMAIEWSLDLLSLKVGLGINRYGFDTGVVYTNVTESKNSNKDLQESVNKQRIATTKFLKGLIKNTLILAKSLGETVNPETNIVIRYDDSHFTDEETERLRFIQEIREGIRQKWEYRVKYLNEDETTAKANTQDNPGLEFNDANTE